MKLGQALSSWRKPLIHLSFSIFITYTILHTGSTAPTADSADGLVLNYDLGKTYTYDYETKSVIRLAGTSDEESQVQLKGQALLTPTSKNDFVLTLAKFRLDANSPKEKTTAPVAALEGSTSRFTLEDGAIKDFYITGSESAWVVNYHRAIASIFSNYALKDSQTSRAFYFENDVSGNKCPTEYQITTDSTFIKLRDLNKCTDRDGGYTEQFGVPLPPNGPPGRQDNSDTSIRSKQECTQKYANRVLNTAECTEDHTVTLLNSGKDNGGKAKVTAKIELKSVGAAISISSPSKLSTINFDHTGTDLRRGTEESSAEIIEALTGKLCLSTGVNGLISSNTASVFLTLKSKMRFVSNKVLSDVYAKLEAGKVCPATGDHLKKLVKLYVDAATLAGSTESIAFVANLIKLGSVSVNSQKRFRLFSALANRPGEEALTAVLAVLTSDTHVNSKYLLTASGIAHQYCLGVNKDCKSNAAYVAIVDEIAKETQENCNVGNSDEKKAKRAVIGLQALGNLDSLTSNAVTAISSCLTKADRFKIHAFQAFRRDPCQEGLKAEARKVLKNQDLPAHIRLSAYLALSHCYTKVDSDTIRSFIRTEESIQVVSFLKSHRENRWDCPVEAALDSGLFDGVEGTRHRKDPRKFSNSLSYASDEESYSANVIFSDDSFLPKIVYANSSQQLFGQEFGGIEVGAHLGGIEQEVMERFFGPRGSNPTKFQARQRIRAKRQTSAPTVNQNELDVFHAQVKPDERVIETSDFYFRLFGTTIYANTFNLDEFLTKTNVPVDPFAENYVKEEKYKSIDFTETYPLYGDELIIPTVSGLSLWIHNEGAAIVSLKFSHSSSDDMYTFTPKLSPGVSIANNMKMSIAGDIIEAGLRAETKAAVSTEISIIQKLVASEDDYGMEVRIALPQGDVNLVDISNELFWTLQMRHADYDMKTPMKTTNALQVNSVRCAKYLPILTGLQACLYVKLPPLSGKHIPSFPLSGPASISLKLSPPTAAKELLVSLKFTKPKSNQEQAYIVEVDTPGSLENKKIVLTGAFKLKEGDSRRVEKFSVNLDSPTKKAGFSGEQVTGTPGVSDTTFTASNDGKEYKVFIKLRRSTETTLKTGALGLRYKLPDQDEIEVFSFDYGYLLEGFSPDLSSLDFKVNDFLRQPTKEYFSISLSTDRVRGEYGRILEKKIKDFRFSCHGKQIFLINGSLKPDGETTYLDLDTKFLLFGQEEEAKVTGEFKSMHSKTILRGSLSSSLHPILNSDFLFSSDLPRTLVFQTAIEIKQVGPTSEGGIFKVDIENDHNEGKSTYAAKIFYPPKNINTEKSYEFEYRQQEVLRLNAHFKTGADSVGDVKIHLNFPKAIYTVDISGALGGKKLAFTSQNSRPGNGQVFDHTVSVQPGFTGSVRHAVYFSSDAEGAWKIRETTVKSDAFPDEYLVNVKYNIDGNKKPKLLKQGGGKARVDVTAGPNTLFRFILSNKEEAANSFNVNLETFIDRIIVTTLEVKCNLEDEKLSFSGTSQTPPLTGPPRFLDFIVTGKAAGDQPGERTFGGSFDLKLNGVHDQSASVSVKTNNVWKRVANDLIFNSENNVNIYGKTQKTIIEVNSGVDLARPHSLSIVYTSPYQKTTKVKLSSEIELSPTTKFLTLKHEFSEESRGFSENGKLEVGLKNFNPDQSTGEFVTKYEFVEQSGLRNQLHEIKLNCGVEGGSKVVTLTLAGFKGLLGKNVKYDTKVEVGGGKYGVNILGGFVEPGSKVHLLKAKLEKTSGTALHKYLVDVAQDFNYDAAIGPRFAAQGTTAYRFKSATNFEFQNTGSYQITTPNGKKKFSTDRIVKAGPGFFDFQFSYQEENPGEAPVTGDAKVKVDNGNSRLSILLNFQHPMLTRLSESPAKNLFNFNFETTKDINNLALKVSGKLPSPRYETFSLDLGRTVSQDGYNRATRFGGKLDDNEIDLSSSLVLTDSLKTIDVTVKLNKDFPKKIILKYSRGGSDRSAEATFEWGEGGKVINSKGIFTNDANDGYTATFDFDSPALQHKWNLEISRQQKDAKNSYSFVMQSPSTNQLLSGQFDKEQEHGGVITYGGNLKVDLSLKYKLFFDGKFTVALIKNSAGNNVVATVEYIVGENRRSRFISVKGGTSNIEKNLEGKLCLSPSDCFQLNVKLSTAKLDQGYELSLNRGEFSASASLSLSVSPDTRTRTMTFTSKFNDPVSKIKKDIGITLYIKPGTTGDLELIQSDISSPPSKVVTRGIEVFGAERTYGVEFALGYWNDADIDYKDITLWFDKKNSPDQKLIIGLTTARSSVQEEGQGKDIFVTIHHHKLPRDLKITTKYRYGMTNKVFDLKAEIDIFKRSEDKIGLSLVLLHDVVAENYNIEYVLNSRGLGISLVTTCEKLSINAPNYSGTCKHIRKAPGAEDINRTFKFSTVGSHVTFEIDSGDQRMFYYKREVTYVREKSPYDPTVSQDTPALSLELQFPGMTDSRIINLRGTRNPLKITLTTQPSSSKSSTSFWIGSTNALGSGWGITRTDENGVHQNLVNFDAVVRSKELELDFVWNKDNIREYLDYVVKRSREVKDLVSKTFEKSDAKKAQNSKAIRAALRGAFQDFEPLFQWYETQFTEIGKKYGVGPVKIPRLTFLSADTTLEKGAYSQALSDACDNLSRNVDSLNEFLESVAKRPTLPRPEDVKERVAKVSNLVEAAAKSIRAAVEAGKPLKEKYPFLQKYGKKLREKAVETLQSTYDRIKDDLNTFFPYPEVEHFLEHFNDYFEIALLEPEKISQANRTEILDEFGKALEQILTNTYSVNFARGQINAKIPLLLHAESLRKTESTSTSSSPSTAQKESTECLKTLLEDPGTVLPPVNATAFIIGNSHYVTFDGTVGRFEKTCQYLMTSDFVNKNFSVVFDLGSDTSGRGIGSSLLITNGASTIGITRGEYGVSVIWRGEELDSSVLRPFYVGPFVIYDDSSFVMIDGDMGVTIGCTTSFQLCAVQVSGFYHGKLQGLFGKYNNAANDDFTLPNGQVTTNDGIFQKNWKLNKECSGKSVRKSDAISSELYRTLGRQDLEFDTFFTRSRNSPHRLLEDKQIIISGVSVVFPSSILSLLFVSLLSLLLTKFVY